MNFNDMCHLCGLPKHPYLNCEAVQNRLLEIALTAKPEDPIPYEEVCKSGRDPFQLGEKYEL